MASTRSNSTCFVSLFLEYAWLPFNKTFMVVNTIAQYLIPQVIKAKFAEMPTTTEDCCQKLKNMYDHLVKLLNDQTNTTLDRLDSIRDKLVSCDSHFLDWLSFFQYSTLLNFLVIASFVQESLEYATIYCYKAIENAVSDCSVKQPDSGVQNEVTTESNDSRESEEKVEPESSTSKENVESESSPSAEKVQPESSPSTEKTEPESEASQDAVTQTGCRLE